MTYDQAGFFLTFFVRATTSLEWHLERSICKVLDNAFHTQQFRDEMSLKGLSFVCTSRDANPVLCHNVHNYDFELLKNLKMMHTDMA